VCLQGETAQLLRARPASPVPNAVSGDSARNVTDEGQPLDHLRIRNVTFQLRRGALSIGPLPGWTRDAGKPRETSGQDRFTRIPGFRDRGQPVTQAENYDQDQLGSWKYHSGGSFDQKRPVIRQSIFQWKSRLTKLFTKTDSA